MINQYEPDITFNNGYYPYQSMPQKGQKTVTLSKSFLDNLDLDNIAKINQRSVASLISLCVQKEFGDKSQKDTAKKILESMVR